MKATLRVGWLLCAGLAAWQFGTWPATAGNITLPLPIYFENFEEVAEGSLPAGWSQVNYSDINQNTYNLQDLDSAPFATWLVLDRSRFGSNFLSYTTHTPVDYSQVLSVNPNNIVNGQTVTNLATGKFVFATSGYREGNQVMYLFTRDYNLSGRTNVYVAYHSLYEQNQDSLGALEYSIDAGQHWLPVVYMLDGPDVITNGSGTVNAIATFTNRYSDVAVYTDPISHQTVGGYYGAFIAAPISTNLAPFISARVNDDPVESKRVELFRLPAADNQATVRFRFAQAGTDSWYWGIDDFGLYSITPGQFPSIASGPVSVNAGTGSTATFSVTATGPGPLTYQWLFNGTNISGATNSTLVLSGITATSQGVYTVIVSNPSSAVQSGGAVLTVYELAVTGQWDFDYGDLRATVGTALEYVSDTASITTFPAVPIGADNARVMAFGSNSITQGFYMRHGAKPNGGGRFVNQYTLLMDVMYPSTSNDHLRALFQSDPFNHAGNDADFYVGDNTTLPDPDGLGANGQYDSPLAPDTWYRIAFAVDLTAPNGAQLTKYANGVKVASQSLPGGIDGRYALGPTALLFTSGLNPGGLTRPGFVNSIQFVNGWMSPEAIAALGNYPTAKGLPPGDAVIEISTVLQSANITLQWSGRTGPFTVQTATSLVLQDWQDLGSSSSNRSLTLPIGTTAAFYRVKQLQPDIQVGQLPAGEQSIPSKQILYAAGQQTQFFGRPVDLALSPDGTTIYVKNMNNLLVVDVATWSVLQTLAYTGSGASMHGIAVAKDGSHVYVTGSGNELYEAAIATNRTASWSRTISLPSGSDPCGIALSSNGARAYVCLSINNTLAVVDLAGGTVTQQINVGVAPWDVVLSPDQSTAYVSDWGGRRSVPGDATATSAGTPVVIDARGIASSGVVSFVNLAQGLETAEVATGLHPSDLELSADGLTLYVANANSDTVTVCNTGNGTVQETILIRPDATLPFGSEPDGLALSKDGKTLFVACAGNNAVAQVELPNAQHTNSIIQGFVPTDWYPGAVVADSNCVYTANVKGLGTRYGQPVTTSWDIGEFLGTASKIPIPDAEALSKYTARVQENGLVPQIRATQQPAAAGQSPVPVPRHVGEPSVFQHVLYILKENKTYDQVFGDLPQGNGNSNLCIYPQFVSPNHHALATQYVLLDNFYCNGVNSADGHSWSTEANNTDHLEKSFGGFSRSYTFGDDPLTYSSSGFIWNNVLQHGLTFRNFGEMDYAYPVPGNSTWLQVYADYTNHAGQIRFSQNIGVASLRTYSSTNVPGWNLGIPDVLRADGFIKEFNTAQTNGVWPAFTLLYLPNDHTSGSSPGSPTPRAQVADNDLALGRVVEAVTKSVFASTTVIFVIEDDPQSGYDHVDGHRSLCLVVSPYTKRHQVISTFYNQAGMLHTIEQILGLPPMNQQDAMGPLMTDCFTNTPNFTPYTALANNIALNEMNPGTTGSLSPKDRYWAWKSQKLDFSKPDLADENTLNRIVWHSIKGNTSYPSAFAGAHGRGLKNLNLVLTKTGRKDDDDD